MSAWRHPRLSCGAFPRENDSPAPRLRALTAFPRRERVVYPDGNRDAVAALSALLAPDVQLTAPDVQVLPADASPALEAALWAEYSGENRDLQRWVDEVRSTAPSCPAQVEPRAHYASSATRQRRRRQRPRPWSSYEFVVCRARTRRRGPAGRDPSSPAPAVWPRW